MRLSELIAKIGDENIVFQNLLTCIESANQRYKPRRGTITFCTEPEKVADIMDECLGCGPSKTVPFIVWVPRDKLEEVIKKG